MDSRRDRRHKAGLCGDCGQCRPKAGLQTCQSCMDKAVARTSRCRDAHTASGKCRCGAEPRPGHKSCQPCADINAAAQAAWRKRNHR